MILPACLVSQCRKLRRLEHSRVIVSSLKAHLSAIGVFRGPREPSAVKGFDWLDPIKGVGVDTDRENSEQPAAPYYMMCEGNTIRTDINVDTMS